MNAPTRSNDGFAMAVAVEGGIALLAIALAWIFRVPLREQFAAWRAPFLLAVARGLAATVPMLMVFGYLVSSKLPLFVELREQVEWLVKEMFPSASIPQFAMVATLAGVGEELLFRGVLQAKLIEWTTPLVGIVFASLLFGFAHALSKLYFAFAVVVGAFLGWLAFHYNDLVAPIVAHGLYDFLALVYIARVSRSDMASHATSTNPTSPDDVTDE